jgi:hypothetical protein
MDEQQVQYEVDRGKVQIKWLAFLQLRPEVANLPELQACAHLNGWLRACGEKLVKPEVSGVSRYRREELPSANVVASSRDRQCKLCCKAPHRADDGER